MRYQVTELIPNDHHKSFHGKAIVIRKGNTDYLKSYDTIVAAVTPSGKIKRYWAGYSATTARHIKAFLSLHNVPGIGKKDWLNIPLSNVVRDYYKKH